MEQAAAHRHSAATRSASAQSSIARSTRACRGGAGRVAGGRCRRAARRVRRNETGNEPAGGLRVLRRSAAATPRTTTRLGRSWRIFPARVARLRYRGQRGMAEFRRRMANSAGRRVSTFNRSQLLRGSPGSQHPEKGAGAGSLRSVRSTSSVRRSGSASVRRHREGRGV